MVNLLRKTFGENVKFHGTLDVLINRGHTGRSIPAGADFELAKKWAAVGDRDALLSHETANRFCADLKCVPTVGGGELVSFRGRLDDPEITSLAGHGAWQGSRPIQSS
jgi:hypothetical protein